jgi:hypothetical protein
VHCFEAVGPTMNAVPASTWVIDLSKVGDPYSRGNAPGRFGSLIKWLPTFRGRIVMRSFVKIAAALTIVAGATTNAFAAGQLAPKISMGEARAMALKLAPGKIISSEYEKEGGIWRYSFDIQQTGHVQEIGIDGQTGKIVENKSEGRVDHD